MRSSGNRPPEHSHSSSLTPSRHTRLSDLMALRKSSLGLKCHAMYFFMRP